MTEEHGLSRRQVIAAGGVAATTLAATKLASAKVDPVKARFAPLVPGNETISVAFVMDDAATMIDFAGPWEVFQDAGVADVPGFYPFTVASTLNQLQTTGGSRGEGADHAMTGLKFNADYTFATAPQPRVVVMGAQMGGKNPEKLAWIRKAAEKADIVMSVCTGAFVLARTGLLDGREATTHHNFFDSFAKEFPNVRLNRGSRFVDNGKFITAGGLTSGIDGALHVVTRYYGEAAARKVAEYMEYKGTDWIA